MPRINAPQGDPEGINVVLEHPFGMQELRTGPLLSSIRYIEPPLESTMPDKKIEIIAMPNRPGIIRVIERHGARHEKMVVHDGEIDRGDTDELIHHLESIRGLPTDPEHDIYGLNERLAFTWEGIWDNGAEEGGTGRITDEERSTFRNTVESIHSLARMKARREGPI